jgi:type 1 glutamine amidotransferase
MFRIRDALVLLVLSVPVPFSFGGDGPAPPQGPEARYVYGEWQIRVRPDQGAAYERLIEKSGLALFREAGGRMVGWWKTLVGDLYEHVTIWEYDDMAAFEKAIERLSNNAAFARFVAARDPLLAGEESKFWRLGPQGRRPRLGEPASFVVHETHRVPLSRRQAYLEFMTGNGLGMLEQSGFRPVGPWVADLGRWSDITYLFRFESLAERERLMSAFARKAEGRSYGEKIANFVDEITTRLLIPAPFARPGGPSKGSTSLRSLPTHERLAPGVHAAGSSDAHRSANWGWAALEEETLLIDLPRGCAVPEFLALVSASGGKPIRTLALTNVDDGDVLLFESLLRHGITRVVTSPGIHAKLHGTFSALKSVKREVLDVPSPIGTPSVPVEYVPLDQVAGRPAAAIHLASKAVLFAGPVVVHGPRTPLARSDTELWISTLRRLAALAPARVVPGFGSWGGPDLLTRQGRFLTELRRQVGYHVAQGRPVADLRDQVRLPADCLVWMPYDTPTVQDLDHVYRELTAPSAPFQGRPPVASDLRPHALVLMGDQPHEPGHIEEGLQPVFEATGVVPHFAVDVRSLSAENLAKVQLLVVLRDGLQRPGSDPGANFTWITREQELAIVRFVEEGGGFLNLHNSMGLYPADGPYLNLVGGRFTTHGPLERFQVEVIDADHPVTRGVGGFFVADEQHMPEYDAQRVHLLLRSRSNEGRTAAAGWVREVGRGRLCHLANGHTREALLHPMFQQLLRNAARWCLRFGDSSQTATPGG